MKNTLIKYLEQIQSDESLFPMDSIHTGKKLKIIRDKEPNEVNNEKKEKLTISWEEWI